MKRVVSDTWFLEVFFLLLSWAFFVVNVVLLQNFDEEPVFSWYDLGLNTVVSTLSTASKSSVLFVVSSCIGQWTYTAFSQSPGPIINFDTHDSASRGPWGSVILLWRQRNRLYKSPPALGAALVIMSLFVDPFFQQIVALGKLQTTHNQNLIQIPRAVRYSKGIEMPITTSTIELPDGSQHKGLGTWTDYSMQAAIRSGLASPNAKVRIDARCPSTTCAWEKYTTMAVCSKCFDISENLSKETKAYGKNNTHMPQGLVLWGGDSGTIAWIGDLVTYYLPNGLYMEYPTYGLGMVISGTYNTSKTISFKNETRLLWSVASIKYQNESEALFTASECGLSLCMKELTSTSVNGILEEQSFEIDVPIIPNSQKPSGVEGQNLTDPEAGSFVTLADNPRQDLTFEGNFSITQSAINTIAKELERLLVARIPDGGNATLGEGIHRLEPSGYYILTDENNPGDTTARYEPDPMKVLYSSADLGELFEQLAESMTNNLRLEDESSTVVFGTGAVVVYRIRWIYIVLPAVSLLGSTIFFILSVCQTRRARAPLWKSSAVAILKCGATLEGFARGQNNVSEMELLAKSTTFELTRFSSNPSSMMLKQTPNYVPADSGQEVDTGRHSINHEMNALSSERSSLERTHLNVSIRSISPFDDFTSSMEYQ